jgi:hypothetical protein
MRLLYGARFLTEIYTRGYHWFPRCSPEASRHVTNGIPLGRPLFLPGHTVNRIQTLKALPKIPHTGSFNGWRDTWFGALKQMLHGALFLDINFYSRMPLVSVPVRSNELLHARDPIPFFFWRT